ncbi:Inner membrane protein YqjF [compost metagenome]
MQAALDRYAPLVARLFLSWLFLYSAYGKLTGFSGYAAYMGSKGMPFVPFFLAATIVLLVVGGVSVLLGFKARIGSLPLLLFLLPTTLIFHNFWAFEGAEQQTQLIQFMKNLAIMGGVLMVTAFGAGPLSLDARNTAPRA